MINKDSTRDEVLAKVTTCGIALQFASDTLKNDKEVVLAAVKEFGFALMYASKILQNDEEIVLAAVQDCGLALQFASDTLKNDKEIALAAVKQNHEAIKFAGDDLKNNRAFQFAAMKANPSSRCALPEKAFLDHFMTFVKKMKPVSSAGKTVLELSLQIEHLFINNSVDLTILSEVLIATSNLLSTQPNEHKEQDFIALTQKLLSDASPELKLLGNRMMSVVIPQINSVTIEKFNCILALAPDDLKPVREFLLKFAQHNGVDVFHHSPESLKPFLSSYLKFMMFIKDLSDRGKLDGNVKARTDLLRIQIEEFFVNNNQNQPNPNQLKRVLDKTCEFLSQPTNDSSVKDYSAFLQSALKSKSTGMQLLGKLMMALAIVVAGASIAMGLTGVGTIPAVSVGLAAAGLFAAGATLATRQSEEDKENKELIQRFTA